MKIKFLLKKYFIPHEENDHKPHILRKEAALVILIVILLTEVVFLSSATFFIPKTDYFALVFPSALIEMTNTERVAEMAPALKESPLLNAAAKLKAEDMAKHGYFSHNSPDGITPWYWFDLVGYKYGYAGENLAINFIDSKDVNDAWMSSPAHKANIVSGKYTEVGIATASGLYQGRETTFVVQFFGRPLYIKKTAPVVTTKTVATTSITMMATEEQKVSEDVVVENSTTTEATSFASVKGESVEAPSFKAWIISSPHNLLEWFYFALAVFLLIATLLAFFIKIKIQHPLVLRNGLSLMLIIIFLLIVNRYVALYQTQIF